MFLESWHVCTQNIYLCDTIKSFLQKEIKIGWLKISKADKVTLLLVFYGADDLLSEIYLHNYTENKHDQIRQYKEQY